MKNLIQTLKDENLDEKQDANRTVEVDSLVLEEHKKGDEVSNPKVK